MATDWDAVVLGPGVGRAAATQAAVRELAARIPRRLVLDADALFALAGTDGALARARRGHRAHAARRRGRAPARHERRGGPRGSRGGAPRRWSAKTGAIVVLKGPGTLVTDGDRIFTCRRGGPVLASGGTGDVLSGVVGAFLAGLPATGGDAFGAACAAVDVHAAAGDALARQGDRGFLATDLAHALPRAVAAQVAGGRAKR